MLFALLGTLTVNESMILHHLEVVKNIQHGYIIRIIRHTYRERKHDRYRGACTGSK